MPRLVRLYIVSVLIGAALAIIFTSLLVALDVAGLRHLLLGSPSGWLATGMLVIFNTIVFSGAQFGIAVMRLADERPPSAGRRLWIGRLPAPRHRPVPVCVTPRD